MIYLIIACIVLLLIAILCGYIAINEHKARKQAEKSEREARENEKKSIEIMQQANEKKAAANSGNLDNDLHTMAQQLRDYNKK